MAVTGLDGTVFAGAGFIEATKVDGAVRGQRGSAGIKRDPVVGCGKVAAEHSDQEARGRERPSHA